MQRISELVKLLVDSYPVIFIKITGYIEYLAEAVPNSRSKRSYENLKK